CSESVQLDCALQAKLYVNALEQALSENPFTAVMAQLALGRVSLDKLPIADQMRILLLKKEYNLPTERLAFDMSAIRNSPRARTLACLNASLFLTEMQTKAVCGEVKATPAPPSKN